MQEVRKVRNANGSLTVALPLAFREALGIGKDSEVIVTLENGKIVITKK